MYSWQITFLAAAIGSVATVVVGSSIQQMVSGFEGADVILSALAGSTYAVTGVICLMLFVGLHRLGVFVVEVIQSGLGVWRKTHFEHFFSVDIFLLGTLPGLAGLCVGLDLAFG